MDGPSPRPVCQSPIEMSLALPIRDVTRGQGIAFCRPLRSRPWRRAARPSSSGLLGRAAADPSLGRVTFQTGRMVTFLSVIYSIPAQKADYGTSQKGSAPEGATRKGRLNSGLFDPLLTRVGSAGQR